MRIKLANDVTRYIKFKGLSVHVCSLGDEDALSIIAHSILFGKADQTKIRRIWYDWNSEFNFHNRRNKGFSEWINVLKVTKPV